MGSYLSQPVTNKVSSDGTNDKVVYGASSMQGWRVSQEDAHNTILDYDEGICLFAVYDGHGGHEVAEYCAEHLPEFIKSTEAYKSGDVEQALIEGFLGFDATITKPEIIEELKRIAGEKEAAESDDGDQEDSDVEENVNHLYKEAVMPLEQVIEKYAMINPKLKSVLQEVCADATASSSSSSEAIASTSKSLKMEGASSSSCDINRAEAVSSSTTNEVNGEMPTEKENNSGINGPIPEIKISCADSSDSKEADSVENGDVSRKNTECVLENGDTTPEKKESDKDDVSSSVDGEAAVLSKGKGKLQKRPKKELPQRSASQMYRTLLAFKDESEEESDEDEEDQTFVGPEDNSSDEDLNATIESSDEVDDEEDDDDDDNEEEEEEEEESEYLKNMKEEPGSDSGCTAVVALLQGRDLYVANAGDSRCIVCRNGQAVEMSIDHKPEDEPERARIKKAGGIVSSDGRVNGGLNLSRAIGDHAYKQNKDLSDKEQMITALPDVMKLTIDPQTDEFMVLACDGIWNFMSSQDVVDFVRPRLGQTDKLSQICEEMFDHCLAPNTLCDGTGCDNMTAIIVRFNSNLKKRPLSPASKKEEDVTQTKRAKTEEASSS